MQYSSVNVLRLLLLLFGLVTSEGETICGRASNCGECMTTSPLCAWCPTANFNATSRCDFVDELRKSGCHVPVVLNSNSAVVLNDSPEDSVSRRVQVYPQKIDLNLRLGQSHRLSFAFKKAGNLPVDLYVISDMSKTMVDYIGAVRKSADAIAKNMSAVSRRFRMGFGTFSDKYIIPFAKTNEWRGDGCSPRSYSFRHHQKLTNDTSQFSNKLGSLKCALNMDNPESGLDGILQAALCEDMVGWAKDSRKIILYLSDASLHFGGDGLLAGLFHPPEMTCQMRQMSNSNDFDYAMAEKRDYPSFDMVKHALDNRQISVIFGIGPRALPIYMKLANVFTDSRAAELVDKADYFVRLIRSNYDSIASVVTVSASGLKDDVSVKIRARCPNNSTFSEWQAKQTCSSVGAEQIIHYEVEIEAKRCLSARRDIKIHFSGTDEVLVLNVSSLCKCTECESSKENIEKNSSRCTHNGDFICGYCACQEKYKGRNCDCTEDEIVSGKSFCRKDSDCLDRGICSCGRCRCDKPYRGINCECDPEACPKGRLGTVCGGINQGECECDGTCKCKPGYTDRNCDCLADGDANCQSGEENLTCSGRGQCDCGTCQCEPGFTGQYCNVLSDKPRCIKAVSSCVTCYREAIEKGESELTKIKKDCLSSCVSSKSPIKVNIIDGPITEDEACTIETGSCYEKVNSIWHKKELIPHLKVEMSRECTRKEAAVLWLVVGVIFGIILVGIIVVAIWKAVSYFEDRQEYERLVQEQDMLMMHGLNENPLYVSPETTIMNPLHKSEPDNVGPQ